MSDQVAEIVEFDQSDTLLTTYIVSNSLQEKEDRVDVVHPEASNRTIWQALLDIFLPVGFPHSVTSDYVDRDDQVNDHLQDSLQAFASSIAGLLSSRAVLASIGVGDATGSATAALILNVLQESCGRIATILFAHRFGTAIEPECKMYRLLADVLNDSAFVIDCLSPSLPRTLRMLALGCSGVLRALCGVAAGSAKASLSAHFAQWGNLGELNAKDSSQETVISLLGMLVGSVVVTRITSPMATWTALIFLLAAHLEMNRRAVRAVAMSTMNRQRAGIVFQHLRKGSIPTPKRVAEDEKIFERDGVLRSANGKATGHCQIGASFRDFLTSTTQHAATGSAKLNGGAIKSLMEPFAGKQYVLWYDLMSLNGSVQVYVALKRHATPQTALTAWWHAIALAEAVNQETRDPTRRDADFGVEATNKSDINESNMLQRSMKIASDLLERYEQELEKSGWDLKSNVLETRPGSRLTLTNIEGSSKARTG